MGKSDYSKFERKINRALRRANYPELQRKIRDAARAGDYGEIGRTVGQIGRDVGDTVRDFANGVGEAFNGEQKGPKPNDRQTYRSPYDNTSYKNPSEPAAVHDPVDAVPMRKPPVHAVGFRNTMPGGVSGLVLAIIGFTFGFPLLTVDIGLLTAGAAGGIGTVAFAVSLSIMLPLTAASFAFAGWGIALRRRSHRFSRYREALGGASFGTVAQLAEATGQPVERTKKDLRRMISSGACPQGHLDRAETCFIVDDETYEAYLEAEKSYSAREEATRREKEAEQADPKRAALDAVKQEGTEYLRQIRAVNDALPGKAISEKLDRLENVSSRIFQCVEKHPEKLPDIRRLMHYYLPTVLKLMHSYQEFTSQPVQGENIESAKAEIESALDTVNGAFENLLDSLYADDALDVSSDISALETMLKQEGLTGSDFRKAPNPESAAAPTGKDEK